jgi:predicted nuclease with TOPRIM domain
MTEIPEQDQWRLAESRGHVMELRGQLEVAQQEVRTMAKMVTRLEVERDALRARVRELEKQHAALAKEPS